MANYAVIENEKVVNVIVADSLEIAQEVTRTLCIEVSLEPGAPGIGWYYINAKFMQTLPEPVPQSKSETRLAPTVSDESE
jgi:hypothetical protein